MTLTVEREASYSADDFDLDIKIGKEESPPIPQAGSSPYTCTCLTWFSCACGGTCATCTHWPGTNCID